MEIPQFKIYFHKDEKYLPSSFQYFTDNSSLFVDSDNLGKKTQAELAQYVCPKGKNVYLGVDQSNTGGKASRFALPLVDSAGESSLELLDIKSGITDLDPIKIPMYYVDSEFNGIKYRSFILFYPYNGDYNLLIAKTGSHWGDIERVTVEYKADNTINRIYFGAHGDKDGRWVNASDLEIEDGHIVLYAAKNGHGFYPKAGMYFRLFGVANDVTNKGKSLKPNIFIPISPQNLDDVGLAYFCGKIGEKGISSVMYKGWITKPEEEGKKPPMISAVVYYIILAILAIIMLSTIYKISSLGFRKTGNNPLFLIAMALFVMLILLYIRKTILTFE